jgi:hypothetical protein
VERAGSRLVAASPFEPAGGVPGGVAGRFQVAERVGERSPDPSDRERDHAGVCGGMRYQIAGHGALVGVEHRIQIMMWANRRQPRFPRGTIPWFA